MIASDFLLNTLQNQSVVVLPSFKNHQRLSKGKLDDNIATSN